jgi:hypothetical protein
MLIVLLVIYFPPMFLPLALVYTLSLYVGWIYSFDGRIENILASVLLIYIVSVLFLSPLNSKLLEWVGYCVVPMSRPVCACMQEGSMAQFPF